ncbi:MAG: SatD family protein [Longimicrobiales bacterium]|nr:SatD family protein [Longimicrobiales bacterium]
MQHFAIIGDLVGSRQMADRAAVQVRFRKAIDDVNRASAARLTVLLKLTAGDEVQGITGQPETLVDVMVTLSDALAPERLAWGWGYGALTTDLVDDVSLLDGPCLHRAREAVEAARKGSSWLEIAGFTEPAGRVLSALMNLIGAIRAEWTERQTEVVRESRGRLQVETAKALGVSPSTISRALGAAHAARVFEGEEAARALLRTLSREGDR